MLENGTLVRILKGAALPNHIQYGRIVGSALIAQPVVGALYLVNVHEEISAEYPYEVVGVFEVHLEPVTIGNEHIVFTGEKLTPENVDNYFAELGN